MSTFTCFVILAIFIQFETSAAITHWIVTEEGRIQAEYDSIFRLKRPYDLVAFLNQEKLANDVVNYLDEMIERKTEMNRRWSIISSASDVEQTIKSTDGDCVESKKLGGDGDLFINVIDYSSYKFKPKQSIPDDKNIRGNINLDCKKYARLDFSMATFPHLQVLSQLWNLSWPCEKEIKLPLTAKQIYYGLSKNKTSWYFYHLASLYWRSIGNSQRSIDCVKRSIFFAPRKYKDTPLFNLGVMLHRAQCSAEAAILLHSAIDHAPHKPMGHFVLANVYALLGDYNRSVACYNNVLGLDPKWILARQMKHSISCHYKIRVSLHDVQISIQEALKQMKEFQELQENWLKSHSEMLRQIAPSKNGTQALTSKSGALLRKRCSAKKKKGQEILSCDLAPDFKIRNSEMDPDLVSLQALLSKVEKQAEEISDKILRPSLVIHESQDPLDMEREAFYSNTAFTPVLWDSEPETHPNFNTDDS